MKQDFQHADSALAQPEKIDENIYDPSTISGKSLENINGHLDHENVDYGPKGESIPLNAIRRGALFRGKMVGSTLNSDYTIEDNHNNSQALYMLKEVDDWRRVEAIPGAGIEVYIPHKGALILTWQIGYESDLDRGVDPDNPTYTKTEPKFCQNRAFLSLMGAVNNNPIKEIGHRHYFPWAINHEKGNTELHTGRHRMWSGHHIITCSPNTWYRFSIGIFSTANLARVRTRNFKYLYFPNADPTVTSLNLGVGGPPRPDTLGLRTGDPSDDAL